MRREFDMVNVGVHEIQIVHTVVIRAEDRQ
jgi:hypothetical protein